MQCLVERATSGPRHMLESTRSRRAFRFDGRQDSYREFWLTASVDELDQRVQVIARVPGDADRERRREAGLH
jgi:HSP20 family molecular chaperone IbpA